MPVQRIITDIPPTDIPFILALIAADGGTVVSQSPEPDGEVTVVATLPDRLVQLRTVNRLNSEVIESSVAAITAPQEPDWMTIARGEIGVAEIAGPTTNPRIAEYHGTTSGGADSDAVPWCSSFVNFCITKVGLQGTQSKQARSWMTWGRDAGRFVPGCIVVLQRGAAPKGHVGFCVDATVGTVELLGGNQGDAVSVATYDASRVLARRLPP